MAQPRLCRGYAAAERAGGWGGEAPIGGENVGGRQCLARRRGVAPRGGVQGVTKTHQLESSERGSHDVLGKFVPFGLRKGCRLAIPPRPRGSSRRFLDEGAILSRGVRELWIGRDC